MTSSQPHPNPYVGPRAFQTGEKLYGRDREVRELLDLLIAERIVVLYSPSGAGKSSLIYAGLIPALEGEGFRVLPVVRVNLEPPRDLPKDEAFNRYMYSVLMSLEEDLEEDQHTPREQLASMTLNEYLANCPREDGAPENEVLIFDQFEEILTFNPTDREGKHAFFIDDSPNKFGIIDPDRKDLVCFYKTEGYALEKRNFNFFVSYRFDEVHTSLNLLEIVRLCIVYFFIVHKVFHRILDILPFL